MKALLVARKTLIELLREWQLLLLIIAIPVGFLVITKFGYSAPLLATYPLLVTNGDPQAEVLVQDVRALRYADGRPVFDVQPATDPAEAEAALKTKEATMLVTIAPGQAITLKGDALSTSFYRAGLLLEGVFGRYADGQAGRPEAVRFETQPLAGSGPRTFFDIYAPGMIVFALLLTIPQVGMLLAREIRGNTLERLRLTPLRAWQLLAGVSLAQMAIAVVLVGLMLASALVLGFQNYGSFWLALATGLAINFSAIAWGLIVACFVENDGQAINMGSVVAMIQVFVSGSFYQLPPLTLFTLSGHAIDLFDIFPATHGFLAMQQVLCYGAGFRDVAFRLGATLFLSLIYFAIATVVFQRLKMRKGAYRPEQRGAGALDRPAPTGELAA